ncbi:uncharacterized protein LOC131950370 [Physella acuta]|uniref:uncharacterized protein LOC131950370 n=1 Tax=Physella acuta TaxID=109671 RepID=UPI0027DD849D|nr:uncharacterized protein LOC131950370 [Physella acuta]
MTSSQDDLIEKVFTNISQKFENHQWLSERAILAATNSDVNDMNFTIQKRIPGDNSEHVLLPRIPMIPTDMPFDFKRLQFPVRLAFAMTINKAQGQSLQVTWTAALIPQPARDSIFM